MINRIRFKGEGPRKPASAVNMPDFYNLPFLNGPSTMRRSGLFQVAPGSTCSISGVGTNQETQQRPQQDDNGNLGDSNESEVGDFHFLAFTFDQEEIEDLRRMETNASLAVTMNDVALANVSAPGRSYPTTAQNSQGAAPENEDLEPLAL